MNVTKNTKLCSICCTEWKDPADVLCLVVVFIFESFIASSKKAKHIKTMKRLWVEKEISKCLCLCVITISFSLFISFQSLSAREPTNICNAVSIYTLYYPKSDYFHQAAPWFSLPTSTMWRHWMPHWPYGWDYIRLMRVTQHYMALSRTRA